MIGQQLTLDDYAQGIAARDAGMALAELAETMRNPDFATEALDAIRRVAKRQPTLFVDDVTAECRVAPHHFNAWGTVWRKAVMDRIIEPTKERRHSRDPRKNAHEYNLYRSLVYRSEAA